MIKGVIFDLDGTSADTLGDLAISMNEMFAGLGVKARTRDQIMSAVCYGAREFVKRSMPEDMRNDDALIDRCLAQYSECYDRHCTDTSLPYEGMPDLMNDLLKAGKKLAILSNKPNDLTVRIVKKLYGDGIFTVIAGHTDEFPYKPDPSLALHIASIMKTAPDETAFVGDSDIDILTGINAGMYPVGVTWGYRTPQVLTSAGAAALADNTDRLKKILLA